MNSWHVLRYGTGEFVAIDNSSGGYPYPTVNLNEVKFFHSREKAEEYNAICHNQFSVGLVTLELK